MNAFIRAQKFPIKHMVAVLMEIISAALKLHTKR